MKAVIFILLCLIVTVVHGQSDSNAGPVKHPPRPSKAITSQTFLVYNVHGGLLFKHTGTWQQITTLLNPLPHSWYLARSVNQGTTMWFCNF